MTTIKEHTAYWTVINEKSKFKEYRKDNNEDLIKFIKWLIDEVNKSNQKQSCWFEKYWECKKQLNQITDVLEGDVE